jgi:hypothetical protein
MTGPYSHEEVPPSGTARSRYALTTSASGVEGISPGQAINVAFRALVTKRMREAVPDGPLSKEITLRKVGRTIDGEYVTVACRPILVNPDSRPIKSGRFFKTKLQAGALLDDALLGGPSWREAHDDDLYEAARHLAEQERLETHELRTLNETIQLAVLARAGVTTVPIWNLPL